jgi:hypothetical protein
MDPVVLGGQKDRWKGRWKEGHKEGWGKGQKEGQGKGWKEERGQQLNNGSPSLIRWRLVSRVERRESFRVRRRFGRGFN